MKNKNFIDITAGYGGNTRQPFVEMNTDKLKEPLQLSPEQARILATNLIYAAEAAEQDAFIVEFHRDLMGGDDDHAMNVGVGILQEFRKWRDARRASLAIADDKMDGQCLECGADLSGGHDLGCSQFEK